MTTIFRCCYFILLFLVSSAPAFAEASTLSISYIERRPYYFTEKGQPHGTLLEKVRTIAVDAKVAHEFIPMAIPRIMAELKSKKKVNCSIGWYKTPAREAFAVFTEPFAADEAFVVLTRADLASQIDRYPTLASLFSNKNLTLGVANGFSYGQALDAMIREKKPKLIDTEPDHGSLLTMLGKARFSYMLVMPTELESLLKGGNLKAEDFHTHAMTDMPPGAARFLMCSKGVPSATIGSLNTSIQKLFPGF